MAKKPTISNISSGYASTTTLNNNFTALRDGFDNTLSLDGSTPNSMNADFDVNGYRILNAGQVDTDALYVGGVAITSAADVDFQTTYLTASYTGDGSTVAYSLTANPQSEGNVSIYVDGVYQNKDTFSLSGTTITFSEAPPLNAAIEIVYPTNTDTLNGSNATAITYNQGGTDAQDRNVAQKLQEFVSVKDFGAVGDGVTDDTVAIQAAVNAITDGSWLDGGNQTYLITTTINCTNTIFRLRNCKFVLGSSYADQGRFSLNAGSGTTAMTIDIQNVIVDGGRDDYKTGNEPWTVFSSFGGYDSIRPSLSPTFSISAYNAETTVNVKKVNFYNMFSDSCIEIGSYGTVVISDCEYKNIANKTFHVYHSPDDGVTQNGQTIVDNVYAENVGILPDNFNVDGTPTTFAASTAAPQGSFNFIVSHGDFSINNAIVYNYASCGVTADRNKSFNSSNVYILNDEVKSFSNNPQGAFFLEDVQTSNCTNTYVEITERDSRDIATDGSMVQIFVKDGSQTNFSNLVMIGDNSAAKVNKFIRASSGDDTSVTSNTKISIDNFYMYGLAGSYQNTLSILYLSNAVVDTNINISNGYIDSGGINIERPDFVTIDNVVVAGNNGTANMTFGAPGNPGVTGTSTDICVKNCTLDGSVLVQTIVDGRFVCTQSKIGGAVAAASANTGNIVITDNTSIGSNVTVNGASSTSGRCVIANNGLIGGSTAIDNLSSASISGNTTNEGVSIGDVETFTVSGNTLKTSIGQSIVSVSPTTAANVLAGVISSNNILIQTGTSGAGYVTIGGGVSGVTDVNNNKLTVAWT